MSRDIRGRGFQVGSNNTQHNTFSRYEEEKQLCLELCAEVRSLLGHFAGLSWLHNRPRHERIAFEVGTLGRSNQMHTRKRRQVMDVTQSLELLMKKADVVMVTEELDDAIGDVFEGLACFLESHEGLLEGANRRSSRDRHEKLLTSARECTDLIDVAEELAQSR